MDLWNQIAKTIVEGKYSDSVKLCSEYIQQYPKDPLAYW